MKYNAYWISPYGDIIGVDTTHIDTIIKNPEIFGLTKKEIEDTYDKYNEKVGIEGKARHDIMDNLIQDNWIRIRFVPKAYTFTVETNSNFNKKKQDYIWWWGASITNGKLDNLNRDSYDVKLNIIKDSQTDIEQKSISLDDLLSYKLMESKKNNIVYRVNIVEKIDDAFIKSIHKKAMQNRNTPEQIERARKDQLAILDRGLVIEHNGIKILKSDTHFMQDRFLNDVRNDGQYSMEELKEWLKRIIDSLLVGDNANMFLKLQENLNAKFARMGYTKKDFDNPLMSGDFFNKFSGLLVYSKTHTQGFVMNYKFNPVFKNYFILVTWLPRGKENTLYSDDIKLYVESINTFNSTFSTNLNQSHIIDIYKNIKSIDNIDAVLEID